MMTPERLAEIRAASGEGSADWSDPITDARDLLAEVDRLRAQVSDSHHPVDPTHGRGGKTICACGNLSWPCPALASGDQVQP